MFAAASQAASACAARPTMGLALSARSTPDWFVFEWLNVNTDPSPLRRVLSIVALTTSERRRPPLENANSSRARSRSPASDESHVLSSASSGSRDSAGFFWGRAPRLA
jgi:hypothetical protein